MSIAGRSRGQGEPLVLLHGWGLSGRVFDPLVDQLRAELRCHQLDLPGHGDSPALAGMDVWVEALAARITEPAIWLGWSLGGLVALALARRFPERVRGLVLLAATPRLLRADDWPWGLAPTAVRGMRDGLADDFSATLNDFLDQQMQGAAAHPSAVAELRQALAERMPTRAGLEAGLDIVTRTDLRSDLAALALPALWIAGGRDRLAHPRAMQWSAAQMPRADYFCFERAAHAPFLSDTVAVADQVLDFAHGAAVTGALS